MKTAYIVECIRRDFPRVYRAAAPFVDSGDLWEFCLNAINDPVWMSCIVFANELEVPPVKSLIHIYRRVNHPEPGFVFTEQERRDMGALMGFVFKHVLGYREQKERCTVNELGVKTATRFLNGPEHCFE